MTGVNGNTKKNHWSQWQRNTIYKRLQFNN